MKKVLTTLATLTALAGTAQADFLRVEMGAGSWSQTTDKGYFYVEDTASEVAAEYISNKKDASNMYAWAYLKHPIPVIPNFRFEYSSLSDTGVSSGKFYNTVGVENAGTNIDMTQFEVIPYYNILDNTFFITLDLGLDIKVLDVEYFADLQNATVASEGQEIPYAYNPLQASYNETFTLPVPMLYARVRTELPITNLGAEAVIKYISVSDMGDVKDATISDFNIKLDYTFDITPLVQPGLEIGYRSFVVDAEVDGDTKMIADFEFSGVYGGLMLRF
jgi:outer membrane protein